MRFSARRAGLLFTSLVMAGGFTTIGTPARAEPDQEVARADDLLLLVHGYGYDNGTPGGKNCGGTWGNALKYFEQRGQDRTAMKTVGYYKGDKNCDITIGGGDATTGTPIKTLAADLAQQIRKYNTSTGKPVDVVAHSMGGLITRVALLGSAKGWDGFPSAPLKVGDVVTLGTPHEGVVNESGPNNTQWKSMNYPESSFMRALHAPRNRLSGSNWASGTDWSFVGSNEDSTVSGSSGIDQGNYANHKYRYLDGNSPEVTHTGIRTWYRGDYRLRYWHAKDGQSHDTTKGWAPLEAAYNAVARNDDW